MNQSLTMQKSTLSHRNWDIVLPGTFAVYSHSDFRSVDSMTWLISLRDKDENKGKAELRTKHFIYLCLVYICVCTYSYIDICTCAYIQLYLTGFTSRHHPRDKRYLVHLQAVGMLFRGKSQETPIPGVSSKQVFVRANVLAPFLGGVHG